MKIHKSFELLNSEGPVLKIEKREGLWNYSFHGSPISVITNPSKILSFILGSTEIVHPKTEKIFRWKDFPSDMKPENQIRLAIVELMKEEIESINNQDHFNDNYINNAWK